MIDTYGKVSTLPLDRFPFTIGRAKENELVIVDPSVSRRHASIEFMENGLFIVDRQSRNGVLVNGKEIATRRHIRPGDILELGSVELHVKVEKAPTIRSRTTGYETVQYFPSQPPTSIHEPKTEPLPATKAIDERQRCHDPLDYGTLLRLCMDAPLPRVYEHILDLIEDRVAFDRCFLILFENGHPDQVRIIARRVHRGSETDAILSKDILHRVAKSQESVIVSTDDTRTAPTESFFQTGAAQALCVPLTVEGAVTGVIYIDRRFGNALSFREALNAITPLAGIVALKIENVRLLHEHVAAQVIERDYLLAKEIIETAMPQEPLRLSDYLIEGYTEPCYEVGGDYYDFFRTNGQELAIVIGDVSGKGLPSAFYVAGVRAVLHADIEDTLDIARIMSRLERHVTRTFRMDHFLTFFIGGINVASGILTYCNAGHLPPICLRAGGQVLELAATEPALNIVRWESFRRHEFQTEPGDLLLLYTDGLTETENAQGQQFGVDRVISSLTRHRDQPLNVLQERILTEVRSFAAGRPPTDDRTLILVRRAE